MRSGRIEAIASPGQESGVCEGGRDKDGGGLASREHTEMQHRYQGGGGGAGVVGEGPSLAGCGAAPATREDRLRVLEEELALGLLSLFQVRKTEGSGERDLLRQAALLFADELPCMPVQHICNLVLCSNSESLVLAKDGEVVAAATVRHHPGTGFLEIELLAVRRTQQRQGYGLLLLKHLVRLSHRYGGWMLYVRAPRVLCCGLSSWCEHTPRNE